MRLTLARMRISFSLPLSIYEDGLFQLNKNGRISRCISVLSERLANALHYLYATAIDECLVVRVVLWVKASQIHFDLGHSHLKIIT